MLKPALMYREELMHKFSEILYSNDYYLYTARGDCTSLPEIKDEYNCYQYAIINSANEVIGYFSYCIEPVCDSVNNIGLISFDKGNVIVGKDAFTEIERLINRHHRVEWCAVSGNPAIRNYDKICKRYYGNKFVLHDTSKDLSGRYRDLYIYEIIARTK